MPPKAKYHMPKSRAQRALVALIDDGHSVVGVAKATGVSERTLRRILKHHSRGSILVTRALEQVCRQKQSA